MSGRRRRALGLGLAAGTALAWSLLPWLWSVLGSVAPPDELARGPLPARLDAGAWRSVLVERGFARVVWNGLGVSTLSALLALVLGAPAAFAVARLPLAGRRSFLVGLVAISMLPPVALVGPVYLAARALHLRDTWAALVPVYAALALPLTVWFLAGFLRAIPREIHLAARVDGCSPLGAFRRVDLPLAAPGVVTTGVLAFLVAWNEFLFALTLTSTERARTVPVGIALFAGLHEEPWREVCAASVVATLPVVVLVFVFQRRILAGLVAGAVRG